MPSCAYQNGAGQPPANSKASRRMATAPSRDVHRRATAGRVTDTYPWSPAPWRGPARRVDDPRLNHAERRICSELRRHPRQRCHPPGDRHHRRGRTAGLPQTKLTPALRPAGMPKFSGRGLDLTPSGKSVGRQPLPTTTTSRSTSRWLSRLTRPRSRSSGRLPIVRTTTPNLGRTGCGHRSLEEVSTAIEMTNQRQAGRDNERSE